MGRFDIPEEYWDAPPEPYEGAFFDAFEGAVNEAAAKKEGQCPTCKGTGGGTYNDCPTCDGNGVVE